MSNMLLAGVQFNDTMALTSNNGQYKLNFDTGGILVLWDQTKEPMKEIWATTSGGDAPGGYAILQSDGNLVIYNKVNQPVWNTMLPGAGQTKGLSLVLEDTGKIVAYGVVPIFDSTTWNIQVPAPAKVPSGLAPAPGAANGSGISIDSIVKDAVEVITAVLSILG